MRIRDIIELKKSSGLFSLRPENLITDAIKALTENRIGALLVTDANGCIAGILSERDVIRAFNSRGAATFECNVDAFMTKTVTTCAMEDLADEVYRRMASIGIRHIPVAEGTKPIAMLSIRDFEVEHKRLQQQSLTDDLTGLRNERHFSEILNNEFNRYRRYGSPLSTAWINIDWHESVDAIDPTKRDELIKAVAALIGEDRRPFDELGHCANGAFAIAFPNTEPRAAARACRRFLKSVREHRFKDLTRPLTLSIGLACVNENTRSARDFLDQATDLSQLAGKNGGDRVELDDTTAQKLSERAA